MKAVHKSHRECLQVLLDKGADMNIENDKGMTIINTNLSGAILNLSALCCHKSKDLSFVKARRYWVWLIQQTDISRDREERESWLLVVCCLSIIQLPA